jgi:Mg-chelatase subunit ChlD
MLITAVGVGALWLMPATGSHADARDIVLVLDNSGSMRKNDPQFLARVAVRTFLEGLDGDNHVALVLFDQSVRLMMPLTALDTTTRPRVLESLEALNYRGLLTNTPAGLERALYELRVSGRADSEPIVILMTDGIVDVAPEGPDPGDVEKTRWLKSTLADEAAGNNVRIFGIAFTDDADFELIQTLTRRTGGQYYRALLASDIDTVFGNMRELLAASTPAAPAPAAAPSAPTATATPLPDPSAAPVFETPSLSATQPPAAQPFLPDVGTPRPPDSAAAEPPGAAARLPEVSLPDTDLPKVSLPEVRLRGEAAATGTSPAADPASGPSVAAPPATPAAGGDTDRAPQDPARSVAAAAPAADTAASAPPAGGATDDPSLWLSFAVGGTALLLALAALVIVMLRRRGGRPASAADPLMPKAFLNDVGGATAHKSYELGARPIIVGRLRGPDTEAADFVVIDESTVGRRHALLEYKEHSFWVSDQNSLNGTFVNNTRIDAPTRLKHGDRIRFHKHEFEFLVLDMFETDRTMMSETVFARLAGEPEDDDATVVRDSAPAAPSPEDPTVTRP